MHQKKKHSKLLTNWTIAPNGKSQCGEVIIICVLPKALGISISANNSALCAELNTSTASARIEISGTDISFTDRRRGANSDSVNGTESEKQSY